MPLLTHFKPALLLVLTLLSGLLLAQADVSVEVTLDNSQPQANELVFAEIALTNEGDNYRTGLQIELRLSEALFFVEHNGGTTYNQATSTWTVAELLKDSTQRLRVAVQPNYGGVHTITAELIQADAVDWDSKAGNNRAFEDDQDVACMSVPVSLDCGQLLVLRAPKGHKGYTWYRDGELLASSTKDTIQPLQSGAYRFEVNGEACPSGNCCPVIVDRGGCVYDMALSMVVAPERDTDGFEQFTVTLYNQGTGAVSATDIYITASRKMKIKPTIDGWKLEGDKLSYSYKKTILPGGQAEIQIPMRAEAGGTPADYRMVAEISAFYAGTRVLEDFDSTPDRDPLNDAIVDNAIDLARDIDEDDSDEATLSECPIVTVTGNFAVCANTTLKLKANPGTGVATTYEWSGSQALSCTDCAEPELVVTADVDLRVRVISDGCVHTELVRVRTKPCLQAIQLVSARNMPAYKCIDVADGSAVMECDMSIGMGLNCETEITDGLMCLKLSTTGVWAGAATTCVKVCVGEDCEQVDLQLVALPPRDTIYSMGGNVVCLGDALQAEISPINTQIRSLNDQGVTLTSVDDDCFKIQEPGGLYQDATVLVQHEYNQDGYTFFDTTIVVVQGRVNCTADILTQDALEVSAGEASGMTAMGQTMCLYGDYQSLSNATYTIGGQPVAKLGEGCDVQKTITYSLSGYPAGWVDNGWTIVSYSTDGKSAIRNRRNISSLAAVAQQLKAVDPQAEVRVDLERKRLTISGFAKRPGTLRLTHTRTATTLALVPVAGSQPAGWLLTLPKQFRPGAYQLTATSSAGCTDQLTINVVKAVPELAAVDTLFASVEVGEPWVICGFAASAEAPFGFENIGGGCYVQYPQTVTSQQAYTFNLADANSPEQPVVYRLNVTERACGPLLVRPNISITSSRCVNYYYNLGLTQPDLKVTSRTGRVLSTTSITGSRAGAVYSLARLASSGLTGNYKVQDWAGVPKAKGLTGTLSQVISQLRKQGIDVRVDWQAAKLYAAGSAINNLTLAPETGLAVTLTPDARTIPTYGRYLGQTGDNQLAVSSYGKCSATMTASLKCNVIISKAPLGGIFFFTTNDPSSIFAKELDLDLVVARLEIVEAPAHVQAFVEPNGTSISMTATTAQNDEMTLLACDGDNNCVEVVTQLQIADDICRYQIWRPETAHHVVAKPGDLVTLQLGGDFSSEAAEVLIDGKQVSTTDQSVALSSTYSLAALQGLDALSSPFGKTEVLGGNPSTALQQVLAEAEVTVVDDVITVAQSTGPDQIFGRGAADIWRPVEAIATERGIVPTVQIGEGKHRVQVTSDDGRCTDEIEVTVRVAESRELEELVTIQAGDQETLCLPAAREGAPVVSVTNSCPQLSGEYASLDEAEDCYQLTAYEAGTERLCLQRTYADGGVDNITYALEISPAKAMVVLETTADSDTVEFGQFKVLDVLRNDQMSDEPRLVSLISEPYFGRAQVVGNSAVEYLHYGSDCAVDVFTYEVCQGDVCDSATVQLKVFCDELLVYNGFSPNGDGVNDELTILGLGQYPDHVLQIFNREGNMLTSMTDYTSDWRGDISGVPLPEGTYFYVVDLGNGDSRSGYLQLSR